jgi:hypothetical protein
VDVLVESVDGGVVEGRAAHQGPEDGSVTVRGAVGAMPGDVVRATVTGSEGVDLLGSAL